MIPRNLGTKLECGVTAQGPQRGQGRWSGQREEGCSAQPPPFSLSPSPSLAPLNSPPLPWFLFPLPRPPPPAQLNSSSARRAGPLQGEAPSLGCSWPRASSPGCPERRGRGAEVSLRVGGRLGRAPGAKARRRPHPAPGPVRSRCGGRAQRQPTRAWARRARASPWARSLRWFSVHVPSRALGPRSVAHACRPSLGSVFASPQGSRFQLGAPAPGVSNPSMHTARASGAVSRSFCSFPPGAASLTQWQRPLVRRWRDGGEGLAILRFFSLSFGLCLGRKWRGLESFYFPSASWRRWNFRLSRRQVYSRLFAFLYKVKI